jgi:glycosyltransferase involved in cell wall biosynthesis
VAPTYTVIITAFNEEEYVAGAIRSVLAQAHADFELIVVDDGSTDGTAIIVQSFEADPRVTVIHQPNMGLSAARNTGIAASKSARVAFLDSDDLWMPDYLAEIDRSFARVPDAGFVYAQAWRLHDSGRFFRAHAMSRQNPPDTPPQDPIEFLRLLIHQNFIFVSATVRRTALEAVGGFKTSLTACEDYDLWIRMLSHGFGAAQAEGRLAVKRDRSTSMSGSSRNMMSNLRKVYQMTVEDYDVPDDVRMVARQRIIDLDNALATVDGDAPLRALGWKLRCWLSEARQVVLRKRIWHPETPAEIKRAFPDLFGPS